MLTLVTLLVTLAINPPWISTSDKGVTFEAKFEPSTHGCIVFRMVKATEEPSATWPDGHYAPMSCFNVFPGEKPVTTYTIGWSPYIPPYDVDWDIYALIAYQDRGGSWSMVESNRIRVRR